MQLYHASTHGGLQVLEPRRSPFFEKPVQVCMTSLRAMALFYLIRNFEYAYGYDRQGRLYFADLFPDALKKLYSGKQGWVYTCESGDYEKTAIPNEYISRTPVRVIEAAFVPDAYAAFLEEERAGNILLYDYSRTSEDPAALAWLDKEIGGTICAERLWQEPDAAKARYYRENYPEIWKRTLERMTQEEAISHGKPEN